MNWLTSAREMEKKTSFKKDFSNPQETSLGLSLFNQNQIWFIIQTYLLWASEGLCFSVGNTTVTQTSPYSVRWPGPWTFVMTGRPLYCNLSLARKARRKADLTGGIQIRWATRESYRQPGCLKVLLHYQWPDQKGLFLWKGSWCPNWRRGMGSITEGFIVAW